MRLLVVGFLMLCTGAFLDTMRGPLLTVLQGALGFSHTAGGLFLVAASVAAITMALSLNPLFERFGERRVALGALGLGVVAALSGFAVDSYPGAIVLGLLLGGAAAALGTTSNVFVIRGSRPAALGRNLCGLHAMYGAGSAAAPAVLAAVLGAGLAWPWALAILPLLLVAVAVALMPAEDHAPPATEEGGALGGLEVLILLTMTAYVCGEVLCSLWMTSYLVETTGASTAEAAPILSGFFGSIFGIRLLAFAGLREGWEWPMLWLALALGLVGLALGLSGWPWGLALAGGMGLYFPVFLARVSRLFPHRWRSIAVWMIASTQIGLTVMNLVMGRAADAIGLERAYWIPLIALVVCVVLTAAYAVAEGRMLSARRAA
ncbi:MAG: fucose permease [Myxococcota bacterium]|jgi:fucose permease